MEKPQCLLISTCWQPFCLMHRLGLENSLLKLVSLSLTCWKGWIKWSMHSCSSTQTHNWLPYLSAHQTYLYPTIPPRCLAWHTCSVSLWALLHSHFPHFCFPIAFVGGGGPFQCILLPLVVNSILHCFMSSMFFCRYCNIKYVILNQLLERAKHRKENNNNKPKAIGILKWGKYRIQKSPVSLPE